MYLVYPSCKQRTVWDSCLKEEPDKVKCKICGKKLTYKGGNTRAMICNICKGCTNSLTKSKNPALLLTQALGARNPLHLSLVDSVARNRGATRLRCWSPRLPPDQLGLKPWLQDSGGVLETGVLQWNRKSYLLFISLFKDTILNYWPWPTNRVI